jgi:hypothetical protein
MNLLLELRLAAEKKSKCKTFVIALYIRVFGAFLALQASYLPLVWPVRNVLHPFSSKTGSKSFGTVEWP